MGQPYEVRLHTFEEIKQPSYRALQPFGQIPTYQEGELVLFESGSIVFHIAENHPGFLPQNKNARARTITWMFAAMSTIEPIIVEFGSCLLFEKDKVWQKDRLQVLEERVRVRMKDLATRLGDGEWLEGEFSAGDLLMVNVLRRLVGKGVLEDFPTLVAYVARAEARPAFKRAFAAQLAVFHAANTGS